MSFDPAAYIDHVDDLDLSDTAKIDMLTVLGTIMQSFVDRAFGDAPEQILLGTTRNPDRAPPAGAIESSYLLTSTFNDASRETLAGKSPP